MPVTQQEFEAWWESSTRLGQDSPFGRGLKGWAWASVQHFSNGVEMEAGREPSGQAGLLDAAGRKHLQEPDHRQDHPRVDPRPNGGVRVPSPEVGG